MSIYYINDIHFDYYYESGHVHDFIKEILPNDFICGGLLLIGGDIGHNNKQNKQLFEALFTYFDEVAVVLGNHDWYNTRFGKTISSKFRGEQSISMYKEVGVRVLQTVKDIFEWDDLRIGGSSGWCDLSYLRRFNYEPHRFYTGEGQNFSDTKYIDFLNDYFHFAEWSNARIQEVKDIAAAGCDIVMTHFPFDKYAVADRYRSDIMTAFFNFSGDVLYEDLDGKIYLTGHTHDPYDYPRYGVHFINNALGYPFERKVNQTKIIQIV